MNKCLEAQYNMFEKRFMKAFGEKHLCGNCIHMFECPRLQIQSIQDYERKKILMQGLKFVKKFEIEPLESNLENKNKTFFVSVLSCEHFKFDKGENK